MDSASDLSDAPHSTVDEPNPQDQMVKKLVRLALASEHSRIPLRRAEITSKVNSTSGTTIPFKTLLASTNDVLNDVFGMRLTELPARTHHTAAQKRAAAVKSQAATQANAQSQRSAPSTSQASYILTSTLPAAYRDAAILPPASCPTPTDEASYSALYTFIVTLILLSPGQTLVEGRLMRHLARMNVEDYWTSGEKMDVLLKRMERQGYIIKIREREAGGEETVEYLVGPRGKVEVGEQGAAGLVRGVYTGGGGNMGQDELERRLVRSLGDGVQKKTRRREDGEDQEHGEEEQEGEEEEEESGEEEEEDGE